MGNNKKSKKGFIVFIVLLLISIIAGGLFIIYYSGNSGNTGQISDEIIYVEIPSGSSTTSIATILEENGLIDNVNTFKLQSKIKGYDGEYKAGTYGFSVGMPTDEMMQIIVSGEQSTKRFTIPEGLRVDEVAQKLESEGFCTKEEFLFEVANGDFDYWFVQGLPEGQNRLEGYLYPNTYDVFMNASAYDIANRMLDEFNNVFNAEYKARAEELGYSVYEIVTIASLIERETRVDSERATVASVIYNRLNTGMKLQIDATVQYALGETKKRLLYSDLEIDSPYNTYKVDGLPVGPICSPSKSSIAAALYPGSTDYLYYVLKPELDGTHNFASTAEQFNSFKQQYINAIG